MAGVSPSWLSDDNPRRPGSVVRVLLVDHNPDHAQSLASALGYQQYEFTLAGDAAAGLTQLDEEHFDLIVTALGTADRGGALEDLLRAAAEHSPTARVIVLTEGPEDILEVSGLGPFYYLARPVHPEKFRETVELATEHLRAERTQFLEQLRAAGWLAPHLPLGRSFVEGSAVEFRADEDSPVVAAHPESHFRFDGVLGHSADIRRVAQRLERVAGSNLPVLIMGETGTGKDVFARAIHANSPRRSKRFVALNCAELNPSVAESELFGHVKGAFTGADRDRQGRFQYADGGTLFLDELGDIPKEIQVKLLRVLENGLITPVGSNKPVKVDVRFVAATNKDLEHLIQEGQFREDLYFRLKYDLIRLPALRERGEDLRQFTYYFLHKYAEQERRPVPQLSPHAWRRLQQYSWPGNIRELAAVLQRAVVLCPADGVITEEELPDEIRGPSLLTDQSHSLPLIPSSNPGLASEHFLSSQASGAQEAGLSGSETAADPRASTQTPAAQFQADLGDRVGRKLSSRRSLAELREELVATVLAGQEGENRQNVQKLLDSMEREFIETALDQANNNQKQAAKLLDMPERTFYRKIVNYRKADAQGTSPPETSPENPSYQPPQQNYSQPTTSQPTTSHFDANQPEVSRPHPSKPQNG